ncbi:MAG: MIT C-terminal domain-containing protein, partial [Bacteroidales bacterium]
DNYGFIVDYLAEVLKELRKEDYMQDYKQFFELSNSITTRDKDGIAKTFSGLVKVIYPDGKFTEDQAKELIDFAIENRKRVKQQLIKMDETFEEVDFSYVIKSSGKKIEIETLEVEELFGKKKQEDTPPEEENSSKSSASLAGLHKVIRDNQTGISYKNLFGDYLKGATEITVVDPYVRLPYQLRNFMEFTKLIAELKTEDEEIKLHLITSNIEEYVENAREAFKHMIESLEPLGIILTFEFDDNIHDRSIDLNNGWRIILGRGLDIFQKTGGWYDISEYYQEKRQCKGFEVTVMRK